MTQDGRNWNFVLRMCPSGRIVVRMQSGEVTAFLDCRAPAEALRAMQLFLSDFEAGQDELYMLIHGHAELPIAWCTRSPAAALYWCATSLGKLWPPSWVPLVERRNRRAQGAWVDPPLLDRRARSVTSPS